MSNNIYTDVGSDILTASSAPPPLPTLQHEPTTHRFAFGGTAMAYFKIWIVNLVLTIITLGIYSPWAKVRRLRYFYGNTHLDGKSFDFTANPKRILIGRLIAIAIYVAISVFGQLSPEIAFAGAILLFLIFPWMLRSTLRFMARNSQFNNVRFGFGGTLAAAYVVMLLILVLNFVSLGLLTPFTIWLFKRYQFDNTYFGQLKFNFNTGIWDMYKAMILPLLAFIVVMLLGGGFIFSQAEMTASPDGSLPPAAIAIIAVIYAVMLLIFPLMQGYIHRAIWGKLTLGDNCFVLVNFSPLKFAFISLTNVIATVLSVGLLHPWAAVRMHRYKTETLALSVVDDFDALTTPSADNISPLAEEISDVFDFDVSW